MPVDTYFRLTSKDDINLNPQTPTLIALSADRSIPEVLHLAFCIQNITLTPECKSMHLRIYYICAMNFCRGKQNYYYSYSYRIICSSLSKSASFPTPNNKKYVEKGITAGYV